MKLTYENSEKNIACLILMGSAKLPLYNYYWEKDELLKNAVKISKPIKWGFRPYILADLKTGYTYEMKLLEPIEEE